MVHFQTLIKQFKEMGEKTGWTYIDIPSHIAQEIKADCKVSFRVKGKIDDVAIYGIALLPMGEGNFILAINKSLQKAIGKRKGAMVNLSLVEDQDFKFEIPKDLADCLADVKNGMAQFLKLPKSHQNYYIKWINEAKTEATRVKRLAQTAQAMELNMNYGEMIRFNKGK